MGCGVSRPETDEGEGDCRGGSIGKESGISDSYISETSTQSKISKTGGENTSKEEEDECKDEEEKGDELKVSSPSFRIYCVFPRDPNDNNVVDDLPRNNHTSDENKEPKGRRQEAVGTRIRRRFNNVKKLLLPPTIPSSSAS
ncbi:hypothetical protein AALP_AA5G036600 [Arabis alpina]|uniref:Uncharacterized protein n=1 Tax=Arabis alpina TaxID=50452 RepID=A0A087GUR0_ARAAL|nr:hypothetical protein AALP_AA5G036600 [Arabis alpina]